MQNMSRHKIENKKLFNKLYFGMPHTIEIYKIYFLQLKKEIKN